MQTRCYTTKEPQNTNEGNFTICVWFTWRTVRHSEELDILWISKWVNSFDQIFRDDKSTNVLYSFMTNVIHTAHNRINDGRHTQITCLALKAEPPMGLHRDELTESCSGIGHCEPGGSLVRRRRLGPRRPRGMGLTEESGSNKDVEFFQVTIPKGSNKFSHRSVWTSIRKSNGYAEYSPWQQHLMQLGRIPSCYGRAVQSWQIPREWLGL